MTLLPRSVISRGILYCTRGGGEGVNRKEISCRTGKGPFSCLESSYISEALDSFGWRSAVLLLFFAGFSDFLLFDFFFHAFRWSSFFSLQAWKLLVNYYVLFLVSFNV